MLTLVLAPVRFFTERLERPPRWGIALGVPVLCGVLDMTAMLILGTRSTANVNALLPGGLPGGALLATRVSAVLSVVGFPLYFALSALVLTSADVLLRDSRRQGRLVECAGLAFVSFLPACVFTLIVALVWTPPRVVFLERDMASVLAAYGDAMKADPFLATASLLYYMCLGWCSILFGVILTVVSGLEKHVAGIVAAAIFLSLSSFWR